MAKYEVEPEEDLKTSVKPTLAERQARLEERRKARQQRQKAKEAERAEKRALIDQMIEEQLEDVEDIREDLEEAGENANLLVWKTDYGVVACQPPKPHAMARLRRELNRAGKKKNITEATDVLVLDCLKYPSRAEFKAIEKHLPLLPESIGAELVESAGGNSDSESAKKA